ncbi:hypothetical protein PF005_g9897 [Phytophthora fragariae]|nr:hypothetical protein PF003_g3218 [Phytophthora fragariae]KAE8939162.1 hypothetical protein PF009_g10983 [Phytophthora fragariae]KAE9005221.1 hypothetical protein PF011_g12140 [Phytophthora fragariae]KAE9122597.1 hypothetical protein PF007_g7389 [Phytophthora fragariae]KAE9124008.1 hypothetical protein PF010_g6176 [Phytophthora fragariae]
MRTQTPTDTTPICSGGDRVATESTAKQYIDDDGFVTHATKKSKAGKLGRLREKEDQEKMGIKGGLK